MTDHEIIYGHKEGEPNTGAYFYPEAFMALERGPLLKLSGTWFKGWREIAMAPLVAIRHKIERIQAGALPNGRGIDPALREMYVRGREKLSAQREADLARLKGGIGGGAKIGGGMVIGG